MQLFVKSCPYKNVFHSFTRFLFFNVFCHFSGHNELIQNSSYQGKALNVLAASQGLWSSNNMKKLNNKNDFFSKFEIFLWHIKHKVIDF